MECYDCKYWGRFSGGSDEDYGECDILTRTFGEYLIGYCEEVYMRHDFGCNQFEGTEVYGKSPGFTAFKKEQERQSKLTV